MLDQFIPFDFFLANKKALSEKTLSDVLAINGFVLCDNKLTADALYLYDNNYYLVIMNYDKHKVIVKPVLYNKDSTGFIPRPDVKNEVSWKRSNLKSFINNNHAIFAKAYSKSGMLAPVKKVKRVEKTRKEEGLPVFLNRYMRTAYNNGMTVNQYHYTLTSTNLPDRLRRDYKAVLKRNNTNNRHCDYSDVIQDYTKVVDDLPEQLTGLLNQWISLETE